jgi:uncharacterized protein YbjQ (UPF0145 family)
MCGRPPAKLDLRRMNLATAMVDPRWPTNDGRPMMADQRQSGTFPSKGLAMLVVTTNDLAGHRVIDTIGVVRGIVVRSRSIVGNIGASLQALFGGNITLYTSLCDRARSDAYDLMVAQAQGLGANAILGMRYESNEIMAGITEVLAYGTAVVAERV